MQKVFGSDDRFLIQRLRSELEHAGIPYLMKNEYVGGAIGELPWQDVQQEVWVMDEGWYPRASELASALNEQGDSAQWQCHHCHEINEGVFGVCWSCQTPRKEPDSPKAPHDIAPHDG